MFPFYDATPFTKSKAKKGLTIQNFFFHNSSFGMICIVMKTISILCLHKMFLPLKMSNASKKCCLKWNKTNYSIYLGFHESEGLAVLMLLMFIYFFY